MIVVVGESLVDVSDTGETPGGSPFNVAVALGRLEVPVLLVTEMGSDERAGLVDGALHEAGVELLAAPTASGRTPTATVVLDRGEPTYVFELGWALPHQELPHCDALHVGSLGTMLEPGRDSVLDLVEQAWARDVFVSYDPNVREAFVEDAGHAWRDVESLAGRAQLVKLSDQDAALLQPGADPGDIARSLLEGERTELVLLTRGGDGATAYAGDLEVSVPAPPVDVVDTVGAGDAFMAATLAALFEGNAFGSNGAGLPADEPALEGLLGAAMEVAAATCSRRGAGVPARADLRPGWPAPPG